MDELNRQLARVIFEWISQSLKSNCGSIWAYKVNVAVFTNSVIPDCKVYPFVPIFIL